MKVMAYSKVSFPPHVAPPPSDIIVLVLMRDLRAYVDGYSLPTAPNHSPCFNIVSETEVGNGRGVGEGFRLLVGFTLWRWARCPSRSPVSDSASKARVFVAIRCRTPARVVIVVRLNPSSRRVPLGEAIPSSVPSQTAGVLFCNADEEMTGRRRRRKLHLSRLYSFATCGRSRFNEDHAQIGSPGFSRVVFANDPDCFEAANLNYGSNYVSTTKYTLATFLPKSLFEQFRRVANMYFLVSGCLSFSPLAPYTPLSAVAPLVLVIGATMLKEGIEDWRRYQQVGLLTLFFVSGK
ncbi:hypothetical protein GW17_00003550 [Ensete ventricosum]|nr:hypothetical protein GW17_00003550 [Ensete ventricosum]